MSKRVCIEGIVTAPINWLKDLEVVFDLTHQGGTTKVWLSGSLAHDDNSIKEQVDVKVYGKMLGNLLVGEQVVFHQARKAR